MNAIALIILVVVLFCIMGSAIFQMVKLLSLRNQIEEYRDIVNRFGTETRMATLKREINNSEKFKALADKIDAEYRARKNLEELL